MQELIELLKDGRSRSVGMIAAELHKSVEQVERDIDFLERAGIIRRVTFNACGSCGSCGSGAKGKEGKTCPGCMPEGGFKNMGVMWEIV